MWGNTGSRHGSDHMGIRDLPVLCVRLLLRVCILLAPVCACLCARVCCAGILAHACVCSRVYVCVCVYGCTRGRSVCLGVGLGHVCTCVSCVYVYICVHVFLAK